MLSVYDPTPARIALDTALAEWARDVREPTRERAWGSARIDAYVRSRQGLSWAWLDRYAHDGDFAWCGAFAAWVWAHAGLARPLRREHFASTYRLERWARATRRFLPLAEQIRPGDVVVLARRGGKRWGDHIAICERIDLAEGELHTVEGNAHGRGPSGDLIEGVVRSIRPIDAHGDASLLAFAYALRPLASDLERR